MDERLTLGLRRAATYRMANEKDSNAQCTICSPVHDMLGQSGLAQACQLHAVDSGPGTISACASCLQDNTNKGSELGFRWVPDHKGSIGDETPGVVASDAYKLPMSRHLCCVVAVRTVFME